MPAMIAAPSPRPRPLPRERRSRARTAGLAVLAGLLAVAALALHGLLPGLLGNAPAAHSIVGAVTCLEDMGLRSLVDRCDRIGLPLGYPLVSQVPTAYVGAAVAALPGIGPHGGAQLAMALAVLGGLVGGAAVLRRLGARPVAALLGSAAYLVSPSTVGLVPFGGTNSGFALLPAYVWADLALLDRLSSGRRWWPHALAYALLRTAALGLDGYSFVASALVTGVLLLVRPGPVRPGWRGRLLAVAVVAAAQAVAYLAYSALVPGGGYERSPLDQFRAMGLDLAAVAAPGPSVWWARELGLTVDTSRMWGDGTNVAFTYLGWVVVALAAAHLVRRRRSRGTWVLAAVAVASFVLALGPSLKVGAEREVPRSLPLTFAWYDMPAGAATATLPTAPLFERVPGLDAMRATYRWSVLTRWALLVAATLALDAAARRAAASSRGRAPGLAACGLLAALAVAETARPVPEVVDGYRHQHAAFTGFREAVVPDLRAATAPDELLLYLPSGNDYLATGLTTAAGVRSYNTGGDKNNELSRATWPPGVRALSRGEDLAGSAERAFAAGELDAVVVLWFDLRQDAARWPPLDRRAPAEAGFAPLLDERRFAVERGRWFAVVRPRAVG